MDGKSAGGRHVTRFLIARITPCFARRLERVPFASRIRSRDLQATSIEGAIERASHPSVDLCCAICRCPAPPASRRDACPESLPETNGRDRSGYEDLQIVPERVALGVSGYIPNRLEAEMPMPRRDVARHDYLPGVTGRCDHPPARKRQSRVAKAHCTTSAAAIAGAEMCVRVADKQTPRAEDQPDHGEKGQIGILRHCAYRRTNAIIEIPRSINEPARAPGQAQTDQVDVCERVTPEWKDSSERFSAG